MCAMYDVCWREVQVMQANNQVPLHYLELPQTADQILAAVSKL